MEATVQSRCVTCEFRPDRFFCDMPMESLRDLDAIKAVALYRRHTLLFAEGRQARGIYILCSGRAKLTICSESGRRLILRVAGPGEVLGLDAALSNSPYEITAELLDTSQVVFIARRDLMRFLRQHTEVCVQVVSMLSQDLHSAYKRIRAVGSIRKPQPRIIFRRRALVV